MLTLDKIEQDNAFHGDINITGNFSGIRISQIYDTDDNNIGYWNNNVDSIATLSLSGQTASLVPEPSSTSLLGIAGLLTILRRRRIS